MGTFCLRCGNALSSPYEPDPLVTVDLWCRRCNTGYRVDCGVITALCLTVSHRWKKIPEGCLAVEGDRVEL